MRRDQLLSAIQGAWPKAMRVVFWRSPWRLTSGSTLSVRAEAAVTAAARTGFELCLSAWTVKAALAGRTWA